MSEDHTDAAARARLATRLARLEAEHTEVLKAGLAVPGGPQFSQRLHQLEDEADLIRVQLGIAPRGSLRDRARENRAAIDAAVAAGRDGALAGGPGASRAGRAERWGGLALGLALVLAGVMIGVFGQWPVSAFVLMGGGVLVAGAHAILILRAGRRGGRSFR